jgi:hypothetical protein
MSFNSLQVRRVATGGLGAAATPLTTVANGAPIDVTDLIRSEGYTVEWTGVTTGTLHVETSIDGVTWVQEGANQTANGRMTITASNVAQVRIRASVATTIAVVYTASGRRGQAVV